MMIKGYDIMGDDVVMVTKPQKRKSLKIGRNQSCPCGSGMKFKNCCYLNQGGIS
jgi:uncharacterized protein YecA (UPF0149 family)